VWKIRTTDEVDKGRKGSDWREEEGREREGKGWTPLNLERGYVYAWGRDREVAGLSLTQCAVKYRPEQTASIPPGSVNEYDPCNFMDYEVGRPLIGRPGLHMAVSRRSGPVGAGLSYGL